MDPLSVFPICSLCPNMILSVCSFLDDASYVCFWRTCTKYHVLLQSEVFLKQLFKDRRCQGLSLADLHRGFKNIIRSPTTTYFKDQKYYNHYLMGTKKFLVDIFRRVYVIKDGNPHDTGLICAGKRVVHFHGGFAMFNHEKNIVLVDSDLQVIHIIPHVHRVLSVMRDRIIYCNFSKELRVYVHGKEEVVLESHVAPHLISKMIITMSPAEPERHIIEVILDVDGNLWVHEKLLASNIKRLIHHRSTEQFFYLSKDGILFLYQQRHITLISLNVKQYALDIVGHVHEPPRIFCLKEDGSVEVHSGAEGNKIVIAPRHVSLIRPCNNRVAYLNSRTNIISHHQKTKLDHGREVIHFTMASDGKEYYIVTSHRLMV